MMKRKFLSGVLFATVFMSCNNFDDTAIWNAINELKEWQSKVNSDIAALQGITAAIENNYAITGVTPFTDPAPGGYIITFSNNTSITIKNGDTGAKGNAPQIGAGQFPAGSGVYYWTVDGNWLLNGNGEMMPVTGEKGEKGIAPQLRINETDNYWQISYDSGTTWVYVLDGSGNRVKATGPQGAPGSSGQGDAIFAPDGIDIHDDYVEFTLADGVTKFLVPRINAFSVSYLNAADSVPAEGRTDILVVNCPGVWRASTNASWVSITPTMGNGNGLAYVGVEANNTTVARSATVTFSYDGETKTVIFNQKVQESILAGILNCEYSFRSMTNVTISGKAVSDLNLLDVLSILDDPAIPLNFTINVDVKNPNSDAASFYSLLYIIYVDDVRITDGEITDPFYVGGGQSAILPAHISLDIKDLMENGTPTRPVMENLIMNFLDLSDIPSKITIQVKPSFKVLDIAYSAPDYTSVDFIYGGQ
jgi:hypothetical protein